MILKKILTCTCLIFCLQTISRGIYNQVASQETKELKRTINFSNHNLAANSSWTTQLSVDQTWDTETDMENVDCQNIRQGRRCWAFTYRYISYQTTIFWKIFLIDKPLSEPSLGFWFCRRRGHSVELKLRWWFCVHTSTCPEIYF